MDIIKKIPLCDAKYVKKLKDRIKFQNLNVNILSALYSLIEYKNEITRVTTSG